MTTETAPTHDPAHHAIEALREQLADAVRAGHVQFERDDEYPGQVKIVLKSIGVFTHRRLHEAIKWADGFGFGYTCGTAAAQDLLKSLVELHGILCNELGHEPDDFDNPYLSEALEAARAAIAKAEGRDPASK